MSEQPTTLAGAVADVAAGHILLHVDGLTVTARGRDADIVLVDGFSLDMRRGERVALVGESGSGKSVTARALLRLDPHLRLDGRVELGHQDLLALREQEMAQVRGRRIGMVFQDPMGALNPLMTVGAQVAEVLRLSGASKRVARQRAANLLGELGIPNPARGMRAYPHEFSGGMRQRVVMAMALAGEPELVIADEPTTALDVRVQEQVLHLLDDVSRERNLSILLITHNLAIVAGFAERVVVMYAGRKVHEAAVDKVFSAPAHPYTEALLKALPRPDRVTLTKESGIPGSPPHAQDRPSGCAFHPRCARRLAQCDQLVPQLLATAAGDVVACHLHTGVTP